MSSNFCWGGYGPYIRDGHLTDCALVDLRRIESGSAVPDFTSDSYYPCYSKIYYIVFVPRDAGLLAEMWNKGKRMMGAWCR